MAEFKTNLITDSGKVEFMGLLLDEYEADSLGRRLMSCAEQLRSHRMYRPAPATQERKDS